MLEGIEFGGNLSKVMQPISVLSGFDAGNYSRGGEV